jgi:hypothetical protein
MNLTLDTLRTLADGVILLTLLEGAGLALHHALTGRGVPPREYALNLASGLWLMLALRSALHGSAAVWIALCLAAAGVAHAGDIWRRWRRRAAKTGVRPS